MKRINVMLISVFFIIFFLLINAVSASPFIVGYVNDSLDGINANGYQVILWKSSGGVNDNLTDFIGPSGNSGANNFYMIDCALLNSPCDVGDVLNLRVFSNTEGYISHTVNVIVTGEGFEAAENLIINSKPNVSLIGPLDYTNISGQIIFNCSANDLDGNLANISLYTNFTGNWQINETKSITGSSNSSVFVKSPADGRYLWSCSVSDDLGFKNFTLNRSLTFDNLTPNINNLSVNETKICGITNYIRVSCNTSDSLSGIDRVVIMATSNASSVNYTASYMGGNLYYSDILLNQTGIWNFSCISNDSAGNKNNSLYVFNGVFQNLANLFINNSNILFSKLSPIEDEEIIINVSVSNNGCLDANNSLIGFYQGNPFSGGIQIGSNLTGNISQNKTVTFNISWQARIGFNDIYVFSDVNNSIIEVNESDNLAYKNISVISWHLFYGNITADRILANSGFYNLSLWLNDSNSSGNVYVSDTESQINWASLTALGRNKTNALTTNDFSELDSALGSNNYLDSISNIYTDDGNNPKNTSSFLVNNRNINNVPIINTTFQYNFFTGILWDSSDSLNSEFDSVEKEDVIFITNINRNTLGSLGFYDYEIRVPSKLREYKTLDTSEVYIYFDLN